MGLRMGSRRLQDALRAPVAGQGFRFALTGGFVAVVYLGTTTLLATVVGVAFEVALAIGFVVAIITHFTLQRVFVWAHVDGYALALRHQVGRYLVLAGLQYGTTAAATAVLPRALGLSTEIVYLATVTVLTAINFVVFRTSIFHPGERALG